MSLTSSTEKSLSQEYTLDESSVAQTNLEKAHLEKASLEKAFEHCLKIAHSHYENFPVASIAIPKNLRPYVAAVYAFARTADDFADEAQFAENRMARLVEWENQLKSMKTIPPTHPIFIALRETVERFSIPLSLFENLLKAFKMDVVVKRYKNFNEVLNYCRYSANPVGRIILYLFGYPAPKFMEYSDSICTALQLANFWQDIAVDLKKDRIYIPEEEMNRFHVTESELQQNVLNENFKRLIFFQVERTQELFDQGKILCAKIPGRLGYELRLTWLGGTTILKKIMKKEGDIFNHRPTLSKPDVFWMIFRAMRKGSFAT